MKQKTKNMLSDLLIAACLAIVAIGAVLIVKGASAQGVDADNSVNRVLITNRPYNSAFALSDFHLQVRDMTLSDLLHSVAESEPRFWRAGFLVDEVSFAGGDKRFTMFYRGKVQDFWAVLIAAVRKVGICVDVDSRGFATFHNKCKGARQGQLQVRRRGEGAGDIPAGGVGEIAGQ